MRAILFIPLLFLASSALACGEDLEGTTWDFKASDSAHGKLTIGQPKESNADICEGSIVYFGSSKDDGYHDGKCSIATLDEGQILVGCPTVLASTDGRPLGYGHGEDFRPQKRW